MKVPGFPSIPLTTAEAVVTRWLEVIRRRECAIIIFPPKGDAYRRLLHLFSWNSILKKTLGPTYRKYKFVMTSTLGLGKADSDAVFRSLLSHMEVTAPSDPLTPERFVQLVRPIFSKYSSITFFLYDTDTWFREGRTDLFVALSAIAEWDPRIQCMLFCETDVTASSLISANLGKTTLAQNIITHPYYSQRDLDYFLQDVARFWYIAIPSIDRERMFKILGPHTWFLKEAARLYINDRHVPETYLHSPTMRVRLETIWQILTLDQQGALVKIFHKEKGFSPAEKNSLAFLERVGFIRRVSPDEFAYTMPIFAEYMEEKLLERTLSLNSNGLILCQGESVDHYFGVKERIVLHELLSHGGSICSRDTIAAIAWRATRGEYSDWALDRLISRIRQKVRKLNVDPEHIKTVKKVGFLWE